MLSIALPLLAGAETHVELPVPPFVYGLIALAVFAMMLGALFAVRQASTKLPRRENTVAHGAPHVYEGKGVYGHGDDEAHR